MWEEKRGRREDARTYLCWAKMSRSSHSTRVHLLCSGYLLLHNQPSQIVLIAMAVIYYHLFQFWGWLGSGGQFLLQGWVSGQFSSVQFSRSVVSNSFRSHESQHARPPCPSPTPGVHSDSRPSSQWCHPAISSSVAPFSSCPQSLPASESFPMRMSQLFAWGGQSTGVSALASFLPKKSQGWSLLEWTRWISCRPGDSQESSPTPQFKSINSLALSFLHSPTLISIHDYWKNHSLD